MTVDCIGNLIAKSLVGSDLGGAEARYRLLETIRNYALEKLTESGERGDVTRRHAEYYRDLFQRTTGESETRSAAERRAVYGRDIDDVRAALDWAFSPAGDPSVGVALTISSVPHWFQFSRIEEYRGRLEQALASLGSGSGQDAHLKMQLLLIHAELLRFVKALAHEAVDAWANALKLAEGLGETNYRLQALQGLWAYFLNSGGVWDAIGHLQTGTDELRDTGFTPATNDRNVAPLPRRPHQCPEPHRADAFGCRYFPIRPCTGESAPISAAPSAEEQQATQVLETAPTLSSVGGVLTPY